MSKPGKALLLGLLTGMLGVLASLVPLIADLEERAGLDWLFALRGPRTPPSDVVVVAIDRESADSLGLSGEPEQWPRRYHARLIERLADLGPSVIAVDIFFQRERDAEGDAELASAIARAGNVVLFAYTKKEVTSPVSGSAAELVVQRLVAPIPELSAAALAIAPFPLPVYPLKVSQFWTFTPATGDLPTLPLVALQTHAVAGHPELLGRIRESTGAIWRQGQGLVESMQSLRELFRGDPGLAERLGGVGRAPQTGVGTADSMLRALADMYSGADSRYLNFYGPPRSIVTLSYADVLGADPDSSAPSLPADLRGKAVFVGHSERLQPERLDEFFTVYSEKNGVHLSGVEIAATAFANLLEGNQVTPLTRLPWFLLLLIWGVLVGALARLLPAIPAVAVTAALSVLYLGAAHLGFSRLAVWPPLLVPLLLQAPTAVFAATLWHYLDVRREREHIRTAFGHYLPAPVVDQLAGEMADTLAEGQLVYGICLNSDAEDYTRLAEGMEPDALGELMGRYFDRLFRPIRAQHGIISDIVGDSMLAIWASSSPERTMRRNAIETAVQIHETFNLPGEKDPPWFPPTRLGLHSGKILLGSIGAIDHYEYRAVGDIVNSANRIQELNKRIGTRVLVSEQVLAGIDGFMTREVGKFLLRGKTRSLVLHELIGRSEAGYSEDFHRWRRLFGEGLRSFQRAEWETAIERFSGALEACDDDGVARFLLDLSRHYRGSPPLGSWDGTIRPPS